MTAETKAKLLAMIERGYEPRGAASALDLDVTVVTAAGPKFRKAIAAAMAVGNDRLKAKILELALDGGDVRALQTMLERREALTVDETSPGAITRIERVIIDGRCNHCGKPSGLKPKGNGGNDV